jgi:hypothetical protein
VTLGEALVASAIAVTLIGTVMGMTAPLQRLFDTQLEYGDMHQRLRGAIDALTRDLVGAAPPVMPYRAGVRRHDPDAGVFYRSDAITLVPTRWDPAAMPHTYYLRNDPATGVAHLMQYDGGESDVPLADHISHLEFAYFGESGTLLDPDLFQNGPWFPDDRDRNRFDMDLLRIRRVRVTLRVQAASPALRPFLPDREVTFDVAPRNLNRE